ncbi:MAG: EAL domain-containing protein, partial [Actinomycetota bacterium]|nr:EAL domain-containing protein [Actinomycetota bacterium]
RRAIERDELVLHYQPKASLADMGVHAVEALVRWQHPERGLLAPDIFLPIAEQTGLIDPLTGWVLDTALAQLNGWAAVAPALVMAVNVSARSLQHHDFPDRVLEALDRAGLPPQRLLLEITETALVTDAERAADVLRRLETAGLRLSLDDFGQGYTSLGQLRHLPLSELKIDKLFVMNMLTNPSDAAIVRSVIELGHNLGLDVVAEGVETEEVLQTLIALGCDVVQGYLLAKPFPAERLEGWLQQHAAHRPVAAKPSAR